MRGLTERLFESAAIVLFVLFISGALVLEMGCKPGEKAADTTDQILDLITHEGDPIYQWNVEGCHALESEAAELADLAEARLEVARIRAACDEAFDAWKVLMAAQTKARQMADLLRQGNASLRDGLDAALLAEDAYQKAMKAVERVRAQ